MFIDGRGKLFGKINIADIIIISIIFIIFLFVLTTLTNKNIPSEAADTIRVTFNADDIPDIFSNSIQKGVPVRIQKSDLAFGKVTDVSINDMIFYGVNSEGKWIASAKPNYKSAAFIVEGSGKYLDDKALLGPVELYPGKNIALVLGMTTFYARVVDIEK